MFGVGRSRGGVVRRIGRRGLSLRDWEREFSKRDLMLEFGLESVNWEAEVKKFADRMSLLNERGGSAASAQRLILGLVLNAPRTSLKQAAWTESRRVSGDFLARL